MMRLAIIGATCLLAACGPAQESEELDALGEQAEALELPCSAYSQSEYIASGNWIVCGTRPFGNYTNFFFTNAMGYDTQVRMQSGPDLTYLTVPTSGLSWSHKYYGGYVRIEPVSSNMFVSMW